jgi:hypothetical protein
MPEEVRIPTQRYMEKGSGRQVFCSKVTIEPSAKDEPARSEFIDQVLARLNAGNGMGG